MSALWLAARKVGLSIAVWLVYVPHHLILLSLGPKIGLPWTRFTANVHWLLTFVGAQRSTRRALTHLRPYFDTKLSVSQILRKHLLVKHECFARVRVWNSHGSLTKPHDLHWSLNEACIAAAPRLPLNRGLIILGYHFNLFQFSVAALSSVLPGVEVLQLRYRNAQCVQDSLSWIARLAIKRAIEADRRAGAKVCFVDDPRALVDIYRVLRNAGIVALTSDGGAATEFIDVPFFDGTLSVPYGWAKLAAATRSDVVAFCDKQVNERWHEGFFTRIECTSATSKAVEEPVSQAIRILEKSIRDEPWGWHPWQRLRVEIDADGVRRYWLEQFGLGNGQRSGRPAALPTTRPVAARRPRVAVISNSRPPYRLHLQQRIVAEIPEIEFWSLTTHGNAYQRWRGLEAPKSIRPVDFGPNQPTNEQTKLRYSWREWRKGGQIIRWLREHQMDMVLVQGCGDMGRMRIIRWCRRHSIPCFITGDFNICTDNHGPLKHWVKRQAYERAIRWSTGLMPCGELGLKLLERYGGAQKPAAMYPFTPDVELFENTPLTAIERVQKQYGLRPDRRRIVFSARMMPVKRPDLALAAFEAIADARPEWDLIMAGDGHLRADLETSVPADLRSRILWTGFLNSSEEIAGLYAQSDVLLLPSDYEPWGVVVLEAAAAGMAIVASDVVGAHPELVKPGRNGEVFRAGDLHSLTQALLRATESEFVEAAREQSSAVLHEWMEECDPVKSLRWALRLSGLLPAEDSAFSGAKGSAHWMGTAGAAVVPV
jgi:glycosyltransferase involved in cell wall biosynthesis